MNKCAAVILILMAATLAQARPAADEVADLLLPRNASGKRDEGGYYRTFGSDAEGEKGYLKKSFGKGDHGYKTLDTFHKKLGDSYGFEEHEVLFDEPAGAGTFVATQYAQEEDQGDDYSGYDGGDFYAGGGSAEASYEGGSGETFSAEEGDGSYF